MQRRRLWLCFPAVLLALLDYTLTLAGQSAGYWAGDYRLAKEANPLARPILVWCPHAFVGLGVIWILFFSGLILLLPRSAAVVLSFVVTFSHAIGSSTWLWRMGPMGVILTFVVLVGAERVLDLAWRRFGA